MFSILPVLLRCPAGFPRICLPGAVDELRCHHQAPPEASINRQQYYTYVTLINIASVGCHHLSQRSFWDQKLISYRYSSYRCCSCLGHLFKKAQGSVDSFWIRMKFSTIIPQVNYASIEWVVPLRRHTFKVPWRHFTQKSAAIWWVHTQRLPGACAAAPGSSDPWYTRSCFCIFHLINHKIVL